MLQLTVLHFEKATFLRQFMCLHIVGGSVSLGPCWKHCRRHMHHLTHFLPRVLLWKAPLQTSSSNYSEAVMLPSFCQDIMIFQTAVIFAELSISLEICLSSYIRCSKKLARGVQSKKPICEWRWRMLIKDCRQHPPAATPAARPTNPFGTILPPFQPFRPHLNHRSLRSWAYM